MVDIRWNLWNIITHPAWVELLCESPESYVVGRPRPGRRTTPLLGARGQETRALLPIPEALAQRSRCRSRCGSLFPLPPAPAPRGFAAQSLLPRAEMTADPSPTTCWLIFRTRASFHKRLQVFLPFVLWENNMKLRFTENTEGDFMASPWALVSCGLD